MHTARRGSRRNSPHRLLVLGLIPAIIGLGACRPPTNPPTLISSSHNGTPSPPAKTLFDEEFNGRSLDAAWYPNRWFATNCSSGATSGESQYYAPARVSVANGRLALTAKAGNYTCREGSWSGTKPYSSGWVHTGGAATDTGLVRKPGFTFLYGHVDVRFREPAGKGLWPAIWLAADGGPGAPQSYPWPPEIDMLESYGNPTTWSFHVHLAGNINTGRDFTGPDTSTGFHTVSLDWRPARITWSIDGKPTYTYTGANIPHVPMYLIANLATGGAAGPTDAAKLPATMLVDWIHVTA